MNNCPKCGKPLKSDVKNVKFVCGAFPIYTNDVFIKAEWCSNPTCDINSISLNSEAMTQTWINDRNIQMT